MKILAVQTTDDAFAFPEFTTHVQNRQITKERILKGADRVWLRNNRIEVYREHDQSGIIRYFAVDLQALEPETIYCVRLDYADIKPLRAGCQIGVWADMNVITTSGLSKDIFWKILFRDHDMITDSVQTEYGRRFWINRLTEAFQLGYNVYSLRYLGAKIKDVKHYINSAELELDFGKLWGPKVTDRSKRLMITRDTLSFASHQKIHIKGNKMNNQMPKAWTQITAKKNEPQKVSARIDMSAEVAGAGLCPDCKKPMDKVYASGIEVHVCHADRIAIPTADKI